MIRGQPQQCNTRRNRCSRRSKGFTLVEVLVSLMIFGIVSAMAFTGLTSIMKTRKATEDKMYQLQTIQRTFLYFSRDFEQAVNRTVRDEIGKSIPAFKSEKVSDFAVTVTRAGWRNPAKQKRSTLQRVAYRISEESLLRAYWPALDISEDTKQFEAVLLKGVSNFKLSFLDNKLERHDEWPPKIQQQGGQQGSFQQQTGQGQQGGQTGQRQGQNPQGSQSGQQQTPRIGPLPKAVEVSFEVEGLGEIKRLFALVGGK